jgi:hypothetical protein
MRSLQQKTDLKLPASDISLSNATEELTGVSSTPEWGETMSSAPSCPRADRLIFDGSGDRSSELDASPRP